MSRVFGFALAVVAALGLFGGLARLLPQAIPGAAQAAGDLGTDLVSLSASDPGYADLVQNWTKPPSLIPDAPQPALPQPDAPPPVLQPAEPPPLPDAPPQLNTIAPIGAPPATDTPPPPPDKPDPPKKPQPPAKPAQKPAAKAAAKPKAPAAPAQKAAGTGGGATAGQSGTAAAATEAQGKSEAKAAWGAAIRARIERKKTYPAAANGARGKVTLRLKIGADGALISAGIATSSGVDALDQAALAAVQRAAPFAAAPQGLGVTSFTLPMSFKP